MTVTARWRDPRERFDAFVSAAVTGRRPFYAETVGPMGELVGETTFADRRVELRARIGKRFRSGLGGFLGIDNALDTGDAEYNRVLPRTLYAGVEVHL